MSSDPLLDPSLSVIPTEPGTDPFTGLPATNPERLLTLLRRSESLITSAARDFAGASGGSAGLVGAAIAPLVPMLMEQAAAALAGADGDDIDAGLAMIADLCTRAQSQRLVPAFYPDGQQVALPPHNED